MWTRAFAPILACSILLPEAQHRVQDSKLLATGENSRSNFPETKSRLTNTVAQTVTSCSVIIVALL